MTNLLPCPLEDGIWLADGAALRCRSCPNRQVGTVDVEALRRYFDNLRSNSAHHIGLGDIRLTLAQQDEIVDRLSTRVPTARELIDSGVLSTFNEQIAEKWLAKKGGEG